MSSELNELRISSARLESEAKDATITLDSYKEKIVELQKDIEDQKAEIKNLKHSQTREKEEEKEKRKQEMLNEMMSKIDLGGTLDSSSEKLRTVLREFEETSDAEKKDKLTSQTRELIRSSLAESQDVMRGLQERLRLACEEQDMQVKRRNELEKMLEKRDAAFEELLGECLGPSLKYTLTATQTKLHLAKAFLLLKSSLLLKPNIHLVKSFSELKSPRFPIMLNPEQTMSDGCRALSKVTSCPTKSLIVR